MKNAIAFHEHVVRWKLNVHFTGHREVSRWYLIQEQPSWMRLSLAVISREKDGTYGYKITQDVRSVLEVSESTLYPGPSQASEG